MSHAIYKTLLKGLIVLEILSWTAMLCSFGGNILINLKIVWGFPVWIISNLLWIWFDLRNQNWKITNMNRARILMHLGYSVLNIHGLINWI